MTARDLIGIDHLLLDEHVRDPVRASRGLRPTEKTPWLEGPIGAAVENKVHEVCDDGPVPFDTRFDLDDRGMSRIAGDEFLAVVHNHLYRPVAFLGEEVAQSNIHKVALAAEISANIDRVDKKHFRGYPDRGGDLIAYSVGNLAAGPDLSSP
jgi:hypothetical protein